MSMGSVTINIVVVVLMKIETVSNQIRRSTKNGLDLDMRGLLNLGQLDSASFHQHCLIWNKNTIFAITNFRKTKVVEGLGTI